MMTPVIVIENISFFKMGAMEAGMEDACECALTPRVRVSRAEGTLAKSLETLLLALDLPVICSLNIRQVTLPLTKISVLMDLIV